MEAEKRIKELNLLMNHLEAAQFLREGLRDLLNSSCEVTLLGSNSAPRKVKAMSEVGRASWLIDGLQDRNGERIDVIDALYHARLDKFLPLCRNGRDFAWIRRDGNGSQMTAPEAGLTLKLWMEKPSLSLLLDGVGHFNLTKKFGWVLFIPEHEREALLSPA